MYIYFIPLGGFNDILCGLKYIINYAQKFNRTVLFDTKNSYYKINFADYFYLPNTNIIYDSNKIKTICDENSSSIYPKFISGNFIDIINGNFEFKFLKKLGFAYEDTLIKLPSRSRPEKIIFFVKWGGGRGYVIFKSLFFKQNEIYNTK